MTLNSQKKSESHSDHFFQGLWPCLKGEEISQRREIQCIREELKSLISAPAPVYSALYETTLLRWMEFCQAMPQDMNNPKPYSLLMTALNNAAAVLKIRRGKMLPRHSNSETIAEQEPLWTYAVFTASLWVQLPNLQADRTLELYKNEQEKIGRWHPLAGNLYEAQTFYKILPEPHPIAVDSMACLAGSLTRIIPSVAYRWLTSDQKVWLAWWEVVTQSISPNNELKPLIEKILSQNAQNKVITEASDHHLNLTAVSHPDSKNREDNSESLKNQEMTVPAVVHEKTDEIISLKEKQNLREKLIQNPQKVVSENTFTLEPRAEEANALADIQEWVLHHCSAAGKLNGKKQFIRIPSGLLIRESSLKTLIKENLEYSSVDAVLKLLEHFLEKESQSILVQYPFVQNAREEIISGIILKNEYLYESLKSYPENQWVENGV
jgi:hypothetical protein